MAADDPNLSDKAPDFKAFSDRLAVSLSDPGVVSKFWAGITAPLLALLSSGIAFVLTIAARAGAFLAESIANAEDQTAPGFQRLAEVAIKDMFGTDVSGKLTAARGGGGNPAAADAIGDALLRAFAGQARGGGGGGAIEPSDAPAKAFLSAMAQMALEGWLEGWLVEALSLGQIETFGDLDDTLSHVLGLGRASAAVHGPLVQHLIVKPLEWKVLREHRPTLLSESVAVRQFLRGRWTREQLEEELARQGWSSERIDAHVNMQRRFLSVDEGLVLEREGVWAKGRMLQELRDQGYDDPAAASAIAAVETRRLAAIHDDSLAALKRAFSDRRISDAEFSNFLHAIVPDDAERAAVEVAAQTVRELNTKQLTPGEAAACVRVGILSVADYRAVLRGEGYDEPSVLALELLLRHTLDDQADAAKLRAAAAADRAAEKLAREAAAAARRAAVEAERALQRRGSLQTLTRAVVRGLIPIGRLEEVLAAQYDPDTVAILLELAEGDRQTYVDQQQAAAEATKRAAQRNIDIGALQAAVLAHVLAPADYRRRLGQLGFSDADADLLTATLESRIADLTEAQNQRDRAAAAAQTRSIDLSRFEQLVRRGVRSFAEYDALLVSLGFDDAARAGMRELLELKVADDQAAADARAAGEARLKSKGLSLEQFRRAVVLGSKTVDEYQRFLVEEGFTTDAQISLLAEVRDAVAVAEDAQRRRDDAAAAADRRELPLATAARAARLGIITPDAYRARLERLGYSPDDVAIEMELLTTEIADVQAARAKRAAAEPAAAGRGLSLAQVERAVKAGAASLEDYRARAATLGYSAADVEVLVSVLEEELANTADAKTRRAQVGGELAARNLSLPQIESAVRQGLRTVDDYIGQLEELGYGADDAELLGELLLEELAPAGGA